MREQNLYMIVWDMTGLECVIPLDELGEQDTMSALKGEKHSEVGRALHFWTLRARMNMHRCYEIYTIRTAGDLSREDLADWFHANPQAAADMVRERGVKIYSDRATKPLQVIT